MNTKQYQYVAQKFVQRAQSFRLKKGTKKYKDAQADFFTGVMAAWCASIETSPELNGEEKTKQALIGRAMPPSWIFGLMRGDDIAETTLDNQTAQP